MKLKSKIGRATLALALVMGAIPGAISTASAIDLGQHLDHGPKWPHKSIHFVQLGLGLTALAVTILLVARSGDDSPTSP